MIETERLLLRRWRATDVAAHRALVLEPAVIAMLGGPPSAARSARVVERQNALLDRHGRCFWAMERRADGRFGGWCGIAPGKPPFVGEVEIGWTLTPAWWGQGFAREAAAAVLGWTWRHTALSRVLAITTPGNARSRGLMKRLGMTRLPGGDFAHPDLDRRDPLSRHITYAIERPAAGTLSR